VGSGASASEAWLIGEFQPSADDPELLPLWPADYIIRVTYRLLPGRLRIEAEVRNPDRAPLPFGLGYHPYFSVPLLPGGSADDCLVVVPATSYWQLDESLPTGKVLPVDAARDLTRPRSYTKIQVDDVLTSIQPSDVPAPAGLRWIGSMKQGGLELKVFASPSFREVVVFTPAHRQAFCIEPYTCPTDAINLAAEGLDVGWQTLEPGRTWTSVVEFALA
jgi:aldose 1-epimerase